jgi:hypothetical protein
MGLGAMVVALLVNATLMMGRSVFPEMAYTGITNLDLRLKASFINGSKESEYGEKPFEFKLELRVGYYF